MHPCYYCCIAQAVEAAAKIGDDEVVIKSQILAGGRGLGSFTNGLKGGVHVIKTSQVAEYAGKMLGGRLVTKQSGPEGKPVDTLLIAKKMDLVNEMCASRLHADHLCRVHYTYSRVSVQLADAWIGVARLTTAYHDILNWPGTSPSRLTAHPRVP